MHIDGGIQVPTRLLAYTCADGELVPAWLSDRDRPWLRDLLSECQTYVGQPIADLRRRWRQSAPDPRAGFRQPIAQHVLATMLQRAGKTPSRTRVRQQLFQLAASGMAREHALAQLAASEQLTVAQLTDTLFQDLPGNRLVVWPDPSLEPTALALRSNLALVRGMLRHAQHAEIDLYGGARTILKTAWLLGMQLTIANVRADVTHLVWQPSPTTASSNALAALVPLLPWSKRYRLRARCTIARDHGDLILTTGDALQPSAEPRLYDSKLEEAFAHDFCLAMPDWDLIREPNAMPTQHGLAFVDFLLQPRNRDPESFCELAGLRNPAALSAKLALLEAHPRLLLCLPQALVPATHRAHPRVIAFRRKVAIADVAAALGNTAN